MRFQRVFVTGMGIVSPGGCNVADILDSLLVGKRCLKPLTLFPLARGTPLPVGEIDQVNTDSTMPRTHTLALRAAREAVAQASRIPDAIIVGVTTGGMSLTEVRFKSNVSDPTAYRWHGFGTVATYVAEQIGCLGPALTVSTACSSGAAAIALGLACIRSGIARCVLAGGADGLCRMTYHGFNSLQLIDPSGARPMDQLRNGMSLSEGAGMLVLECGEEAPESAWGELCGAGLSCDAYHPAAPHPEGEGAVRAMREALHDAGVDPAAVGYLNLHGTGTRDNDAAEAKAVATVFGPAGVPVSSVKGALGHSLGAAGAIEAIVSILALHEGFLPPTVGCTVPDSSFSLALVQQTQKKDLSIVASNSFGFGGNNATLVLSKPRCTTPAIRKLRRNTLSIVNAVCVSGKGLTDETLRAFENGKSISGQLPTETVSAGLPPAHLRRLKRIFHLTLKLAVEAQAAAGIGSPNAIVLGSAWGALTETHDFLHKLFSSDEQFPSPTDFVNSVHNAPAAQVALLLKAYGPAITVTGGPTSFEQALLTASVIGHEGKKILLIGVDEWHPVLSPLFDPCATPASDGGGAFVLEVGSRPGNLQLDPIFYQGYHVEAIEFLIAALGGPRAVNERAGAILAGLPKGCAHDAHDQCKRFVEKTCFAGPVIDYRNYTGHHGSASAVAAVMAARLRAAGKLTAPLGSGVTVELGDRDLLLLGFGDVVTAVAIRGGRTR